MQSCPDDRNGWKAVISLADDGRCA
jgi:hypothetical protein